MLGANSVLGDTIRIKLTDLAKACGAAPDPGIIPRLPGIGSDDPLKCILGKDYNPLLFDDPAGVYEKYGVLVRDGGHFVATFTDPTAAGKFIEKAYALIAEHLPSILLEARLDGEAIQKENLSESLFQHPAFQVSHQMGNQAATERNSKGSFVSQEESKMEERGAHFRDNPTDIIALLEKSQLIPCAAEPVQSLSDLAGGGYLALIHADGNSIGNRYLEWQKGYPKEDLTSEAHGEQFFHSMRVAVRQALVKALQAVFAASPQSYSLLMLGGDDLLLVCSAPLALPFVQAYAEALEKIPLSDDQPLSIGAGVAITKDSFPFHRLHEIAETLADSAKRLYRTSPELGSVVDWHVSTNSWVNKPIDERRADSLQGATVLSDKPYPVLGKTSLQVLLQEVGQLIKSRTLARSQLRDLVETLRQGRCLADLAWCELPPGSREPTEKALQNLGQEGLFQPLSDDIQLSRLPDLVELMEISRHGASSAQESGV